MSRHARTDFRRAVQYAREEGCEALTLGVEADNDRALAYYEKRGFKRTEQRMAVPLGEIELEEPPVTR